MKYIVIVNGKPESGKTEIEKIASNWFKETVGNSNNGVHIKSSVEKVYDIYRQLGWDGKKSQQFRDDMSAIKAMYIRNCDGPTRDILKYVLGLDEERDHIIFYDCREPIEIQKAINTFRPLKIVDIKIVTLLVRRYNKENIKYSNDSDNNVHDFEYDFEIKNDGSLKDLKDKVWKFCYQLFGIHPARDMEGKYYGNK